MNNNDIIESDNSDIDDELIYYRIYECSKCHYKTMNDDPDCSICDKSFCMLGKDITQKELNKLYDDDDEDEDEDENEEQEYKDCGPTVCTDDCACDKSCLKNK